MGWGANLKQGKIPQDLHVVLVYAQCIQVALDGLLVLVVGSVQQAAAHHTYIHGRMHGGQAAGSAYTCVQIRTLFRLRLCALPAYDQQGLYKCIFGSMREFFAALAGPHYVVGSRGGSPIHMPAHVTLEVGLQPSPYQLIRLFLSFQAIKGQALQH